MISEGVTMEDVAREAGVSINTVSRALNNKPDINDQTKERILRIADHLGYRPNRLAQGLRAEKTGTLGLIVADIANPFFSTLVKGVEATAKERGYTLLVKDSDETYEKEEEAIHTMIAEQVDGLLISPVQTQKGSIKELMSASLPFVLLGRYFPDMDVDYVVTDDVQGGYKATNHLFNQGYERVALLNGPVHVSSAKARLQGYRKAYRESDLSLQDDLIFEGAVTLEDGYNYMTNLLDQREVVDAVFVYSDLVGFGVYQKLLEVGLKIPEDIAIVGYDDTPLTGCLEVPFTTVRIPKKKLGSKALQCLVNKIDNDEQSTVQDKLDVTLVDRAST